MVSLEEQQEDLKSDDMKSQKFKTGWESSKDVDL